MGQDRRPLVITTQPPLPANSGYTYVLDSTSRTITPLVASAARKVPGSFRHAYVGGRVRATVTATTQNVTANLLLLTNSAGTTNAAWEVDATADSAGAVTVTAGSTKVIDWLPRTNDFALEILAGATAPSALTTTCSITWDPSPAV
jgi:hypothetical protein